MTLRRLADGRPAAQRPQTTAAHEQNDAPEAGTKRWTRAAIWSWKMDALTRRGLVNAVVCGYTIETPSENKWTLCRGSLWHAVFTFDVRKLPTTVTIEVISPTRLHIDLLCHSALTISTPGDPKRISRELDELERQLVHGG
jgi:hypothetical protein